MKTYYVRQNPGYNGKSTSMTVTIPPELARKLKLKHGDLVAWDGARLRKVKVEYA